MKVIHFMAPVEFGGGESLILSICKNQKVNEIEPIVINMTYSNKFNKLLDENNITYKNLTNIKLGYTPKKVDYIKLLLKTFNIVLKNSKLFNTADVIHVHGFPGNIIISILKKIKVINRNIKLIYSQHALKGNMNSLSQKIYKYFLSSYDYLVGVSSKTTDSLINVFPSLKDKIKCVSNGIEIQRFIPNKDKLELRTLLELPSDSTIGIFVARFTMIKNQKFLIEVAKSLNSSNLKIILIGDGVEFKNFEAEMKKNDLENNFILLGYVPNDKVPLYLAASDFCLFPSKMEGFGNSIVEALATGLPTLVFQSVYVDEFGSGAIPAKNNNEFIEITKKLIFDKTFRENISTKTSQQRDDFDIRKTERKYAALYERKK